MQELYANISYLFRCALERDIHFDVAITRDIRYMTESMLEEALLNTLLADLGENAVIAAAKAEHRNILLSLGIREKYYCIDFFDSGADFDSRIIKNPEKKKAVLNWKNSRKTAFLKNACPLFWTTAMK